jgi:hypothetical protein
MREREKRKNDASSEKPLPTLIKEMKPLWYWVPSTTEKIKRPMRIRYYATNTEKNGNR